MSKDKGISEEVLRRAARIRKDKYSSTQFMHAENRNVKGDVYNIMLSINMK